MTASIIILTYKSVHHLVDLLPSLEVALENEDMEAEVIVLENGDFSESENFVANRFPQFRHQYSGLNHYLFSLNHIVANLSTDFVMILNDDMLIENLGLKKSVGLLQKNPELFGVNLRITDWDGQNDQSAVRDLSYRKGFYTSQWRLEKTEEVRYTLYPGGGSGVFRRSMFVELGGFDRLYFPAYAEDMDLGWRAWQRGWPSVFLPDSCIRHKEGGTLEEQMPASKRSRQIYTNRIVCMLRNGNMPGFRSEFFLRLPYRLLVGTRSGGHQAVALGRAVAKFREVKRARKHDPKAVLDDKDIIARLGQPLTNLIKNYGIIN